MIKQFKFFKGIKGLFIPIVLMGAFLIELSAQTIDIDYIYEKEKLGIESVNKYKPSGISWSPEGHQIIFRQLSTNHGNLLFWMSASDVQKQKAWSEANLRRAIRKIDKDKSLSETTIAELPEAKLAKIKFPKPNLLPLENYSPDENKENKPREIKSRWHKNKNHILLTFQDSQYSLDPDSNILSPYQDSISQGERGVNNDSVKDSPDERFKAFTRSGNIFIYDRSDERELQLTSDGGQDDILNGSFPWVYWEELMWRSTYRAYEWSPNNDKIAYFQFDESGTDVYPLIDYTTPVPKSKFMTYPKAGNKNPTIRLGIVSLSNRETTWVKLPNLHEYLIHIFWDNSGDYFYVQGLNRKQNHLHLYKVNSETGVGELVLEEKSEAWINAFNMPMFPQASHRQNQFIWLSERSGWNHLYLVSKDGKSQKPLTSGNWEVIRKGFFGKQIFYNSKSDELFFAGRDQGPLEKHFYSVHLETAKMKRITPDSGNHTVTFSSDNEFFVDSWSSTDLHGRKDLRKKDGTLVVTLSETKISEFGPYEIPQTELLSIPDGEGRKFYASLVKPVGFDPDKKYPVVAYVYGEPAGQVVSNTFIRDWDLLLAHHGFVVFRFDGRGTPGRGREWINAVYKDQMSRPMEDWKVAVRYLKSLSFVDGENLGVWGWSGGGTMTLNLMLRTPGLFKAGAAVAAVTDKALYDTIYTERYLLTPKDNPEGYKLSSPLYAAKNLEGELLIAHGSGDDNVHIQNVHNLLTELNRFNKDYQLFIYPQKGHGIEGMKNRKHLYSRLLQFFQTNLQ